MTTFEELWEYCSSNNRVCPMPQKWNELYNLLKNTKQNPNGGWTPPLPLILAAWYDTSPLMKKLRFREHIEWAQKNDQIEKIDTFIKSLKEKDWLHYGEI